MLELHLLVSKQARWASEELAKAAQPCLDDQCARWVSWLFLLPASLAGPRPSSKLWGFCLAGLCQSCRSSARQMMTRSQLTPVCKMTRQHSGRSAKCCFPVEFQHLRWKAPACLKGFDLCPLQVIRWPHRRTRILKPRLWCAGSSQSQLTQTLLIR